MLFVDRCESGIGRRQDVVEAVAVVARGDFRRGIRFAEQHGLAVIGVPVARQPVGVALAAALVADGLEIIACPD